MKNLIRLNFKKLIPTKGKKREIFAKLKIGDIVKAKVMDSSGKKTLLNIKGTNVLTELNRDIPRGEVIKLQVQKFKEEKILVKLKDEPPRKKLSFQDKKDSNLKKTIIAESVKSKVLLKENQIKRVVKKYKEIMNKFENLNSKKMGPKNIKKDIIKALVIIEGNDLEFSEELFKNLRAYVNRDIEKELDVDKKDPKKFKEDLKEHLKEIKDSKGSFDKGLKIMNALNKKEKNNLLEFMFLINENLKPVEIKIRYEGKKENGEIDEKNSYLDMNLELENLGELKITVNSWDKRVEILFWINKEVDKNNILKNIDELTNNIKKIGYKVDSIRVKHFQEDIEPQIKGVNVKA